MLSTRDPHQTQGQIQTESDGMEIDIAYKWKVKKGGEVILISDKIEFKIQNVTRDKEGHYTMIKGSIQEEDLTIINRYAPNIGAPQYIRQILTVKKQKTDSNTVIVGDFNTSLTPMERSPKQRINKETQALNDKIDLKIKTITRDK